MSAFLLKIMVAALMVATSSLAFADKRFTVGDIKGRYAFSFQGQIIGVGPAAATGAMRADGKGAITEAVRTITLNGVPQTETFTCTLVVDPNGTGSAICPLDDPAPGFPAVETFDFALEQNGKGFRFVSTTPGVVVLGTGKTQ